MRKTPKSLRLQLGLFGRTNVGKSSFLNMVAGQDVAITSKIPGTTTDVVEKVMELLPVGPVVFLDTAGLDDISGLSELRISKTKKIFDRSDIILLITEPKLWNEYEEDMLIEAKERDIPVITIINKIDISFPSEEFVKKIKQKTDKIIFCSTIDHSNRDKCVNKLKKYIIESCPQDFLKPPFLIGDLMPPGGLAVLIVPIDLEAPKGRIILPQVQTIRDALDNRQAALVVKESEYPMLLKRLAKPPDIVVCDSQVVDKMVKHTDKNIPCTTFSILFSRYKGDLMEMAKAAACLGDLAPGNRVLIAEACSHHPIEDDIGRHKIPNWISKYIGGDLLVDVSSGRDYPDNLNKYDFIVQCGGCMITRREMLFRIHKAKEHQVPISNYGIIISLMQGVLERVLEPFPEALRVYKEEKNIKGG